MPRYAYRAVDRTSTNVEGVLVVANEAGLEQHLAKLGLWLIEAKEEREATQRRGGKVPMQELSNLFRGLAALLSSGVDLSESLTVLKEETAHPSLRHVLAGLQLNVQSGVALDEAMLGHPEAFDRNICNLVRAGSFGGELPQTCEDIADHLEWMDNLISDVKQATIYPALILVAVSALIMLLFTFVVPQFAEVFEQLDVELPLITQGVMWLGNFAVSYWWAVLLSVGGLIAFLRFGPARIPELGLLLDRALLQMPLLGPVNLLLVQSRFAHNLSLLLAAGVSIVEALRLVGGVVGNRVMEQALSEAQLAVTEGRRMSEALSSYQLLSPLVMRMIVVGEESGRLDTCLAQVSRRLDQEVPRRIKRLFGVLEPLIILVLIGIVGLVALAILLPLFSLMSGVLA